MRIKDKEDAPSPQPEKVFFDNRIKRKNVLALNEKVAAIREYEKMPVYKRIGRMFHCSPDQIKRIVQQKDNILKAWEQRTRRCQDAKTLELKVVRVSMLGKAVYEWIRRMMYYKDFMITDGMIQKMALQFKSAMGLQNFFPHQEWCDKFRATYKITTNDSKQLNIGYTQGYSVQIKDVMKDVLSECSPDEETDDDNDEIDDLLDNDNDDDYEDGDDGNESSDAGEGEASERVGKHVIKKEAGNITLKGGSSRFALLSTSTTITSQQKQQQRLTTQGNITSIPLPQLQQMRQLVALPIQTNGVGGMTQKVLVATPITSNNLQRSAGNNGSAPMTMTIIPFTTLAQAHSQSQSQCTKTGNMRKSPNERPVVPPPMVEIKTEIKKEPEDEPPEVYVKQEYISDEEETTQNAQSTKTTTITTKQTTTTNVSSIKAVDAAKLPEGAAVKINVPQPPASDDTSLIDDDNLALASLRQLIRKPKTNSAGDDCNARTLRPKQLTLKSPLTTSPPQTSSSSAAASAATAPSTRAANKRKRSGCEMPGIPPIKSCSEARRYLKLLEDFALYKENFRLIGLITRADEVLRELDGDDDVDVD